jgi:hydrogenase maturation factor HypF (carbamoyltransferase family)
MNNMKTIGWYAAGGFFLVCLLQHFVIVQMENEIINRNDMSVPIMIKPAKVVEKTVSNPASSTFPMTCPYHGDGRSSYK